MAVPLLKLAAAIIMAAALAGCEHRRSVAGGGEPAPLTWRLDRLDRMAGLPLKVDGDPRLIPTPAGRAIAFDGVDDGLFAPIHPLAHAESFTIEAIFRPDGGAFEQRWLHLAEADTAAPPGYDPPVQPNGPRFLFEIRVVGGGWYLDAFAAGPGYRQALMAPDKLHPVGRWYHVAQSFDGRTYRSYVNGVVQAEAPVAFVPQGPGYTSIGTRINRRSHFKGAIYAFRFTRRALTPEQFMALPPGLGQVPG